MLTTPTSRRRRSPGSHPLDHSPSRAARPALLPLESRDLPSGFAVGGPTAAPPAYVSTVNPTYTYGYHSTSPTPGHPGMPVDPIGPVGYSATTNPGSTAPAAAPASSTYVAPAYTSTVNPTYTYGYHSTAPTPGHPGEPVDPVGPTMMMSAAPRR